MYDSISDEVPYPPANDDILNMIDQQEREVAEDNFTNFKGWASSSEKTKNI